MSDGQMDEQADQAEGTPCSSPPPPTVQWDTGNTPVLPEAMSCAPIRAAGTPVETGYFKGSSKGGKSGVFTPVIFLIPKKTGAMRHPRSFSIPHADDQTGAGMCSPGQLVHLHLKDAYFHLKDAYFHVPLIPKHRKFLRFLISGNIRPDNRLPFGYSLAPRICV